MPTYVYACTNPECGHRFEAVQAFTDSALTECPVCGQRLRKVFGSVGVVFKGSGFYRNDSRSENGSKGGDKPTGEKSGDKSSAEKGGDKSSAEKSGDGAAKKVDAPAAKSGGESSSSGGASGKPSTSSPSATSSPASSSSK